MKSGTLKYEPAGTSLIPRSVTSQSARNKWILGGTATVQRIPINNMTCSALAVRASNCQESRALLLPPGSQRVQVPLQYIRGP